MVNNAKRDRTQAKWGQGRAAFFAHKVAVMTALAQGQPVSTVYDAFKDRVSVGYRQFCRYVAAGRKHGTKSLANAPRLLSSGDAKVVSKPASLPADAVSTASRGFHFDPTAINDKDLI